MASVHCERTSADVARAATTLIVQLSHLAVETRGKFMVALSGGSLPEIISQGLLDPDIKDTIDWKAWHVFFADERIVHLEHPDSNYSLCRKTLLDHVPIPSNQIFPINVQDNESAEDIQQKIASGFYAHDYEHRMCQAFGLPAPLAPNDDEKDCGRGACFACTAVSPGYSPSGVTNQSTPQFDLILLGIGPDGHTCSLFPNHRALHERFHSVVTITDSPKPPPARISFTLPLLNNALCVAFVVTGQNKLDAVRSVFGLNSRKPEYNSSSSTGSRAGTWSCAADGTSLPLPAALVRPHLYGRTLQWFLDPAASPFPFYSPLL
jgi:6-phosphogluconolactonase